MHELRSAAICQGFRSLAGARGPAVRSGGSRASSARPGGASARWGRRASAGRDFSIASAGPGARREVGLIQSGLAFDANSVGAPSDRATSIVSGSHTPLRTRPRTPMERACEAETSVTDVEREACITRDTGASLEIHPSPRHCIIATHPLARRSRDPTRYIRNGFRTSVLRRHFVASATHGREPMRATRAFRVVGAGLSARRIIARRTGRCADQRLVGESCVKLL